MIIKRMFVFIVYTFKHNYSTYLTYLLPVKWNAINFKLTIYLKPLNAFKTSLSNIQLKTTCLPINVCSASNCLEWGQNTAQMSFKRIGPG